MYDCIIIGSVTLDLFFIGDSFTKNGDRYELAVGGKYVADNFIQRVGGGGANVSIGLGRQGFSTIFWGVLDDSLIGQHIVNILESENIDTSIIEKRKDSMSISAILLNNQGERTIITHHAQNVKRDFNDKIKFVVNESKWLVIGDTSGNTLEEKIIWTQKAKERGLSIFTMLTAKECKEDIKQLSPQLRISDWIILNGHELADLLGIKYEDLCLESRNYDIVLNVKGLIVTDGLNGAYAYSDMKRYFQRAISPPKIVDTTGAGDAFTSGFLGEYIRNKNIEQALLFAAQNAASVIGKIGAQDGLLKR